MGTLKSVSPPQHSNRSTILKVSPMVTEVTFAPLHNTTHVLFWSSFVCQSWQKQHFSSSAMLSPSLVSGHSSSDRSGIGPPFLLIPDVLGPSFSMIFYSSLFAGLLDSAAALDTGTFFCCFASMEFRMLMLVFLVKFPDRNGGKNIF